MADRPWQGTGRNGPCACALAFALICACLLAIAAPAPAEAQKIRGIDVSRFQGTIDWEQVGTTKIAFAWIQASRGSGGDCLVVPDQCGPDPFYKANLAGARANGVRAGAYHRAFASGGTRKRARADARREANLFVRTVGRLRNRDLLPVLDVETPFTRLNAKRLRLWIRTWTGTVNRKLGARSVIYTNHSSWQATGDARGFARRGHLLWVANYNVSKPLVPAGNWNGRGWKVWQFTSTGSVRGISGNVDKNRLKGGLAGITYRRGG
jgi:GH25 family lysozyme M1 (1,4-beta-N-acetylmuramidase)